MLRAALKVATHQIADMDRELKSLRGSQRELQRKLETVQIGGPVYMSVSSASAAAQNAYIQWNGETPVVVPASHFRLSDSKREVTILQAGVYQVNVHLRHRNTSQGAVTSLFLNGNVIYSCSQTDGNAWNNSIHMLEILNLRVNDKLRVRTDANYGTSGAPLEDRLSLLLLK